MSEPIYLDYNATCPIAPEVLEAMIPALREAWGNPSSGHAYGKHSRQVVDRGRAEVAGLLGCQPDEVIFTSGGTESDNAAVIGVAEARVSHGKHVVTSSIEHPAVEQACAYLERRGWTVTRVGVDADGRVDPAAVQDALRGDTTLISIMHANNETGVLQPVAEIGSLAHERGIVFHTDTAQSVGKLPVEVDRLHADLAVIAGHKLYGPKGVGVLYLRRGTAFSPLLHGAGHEGGRRAGTENVALIAGLGAACDLAATEIESRARHLAELRDRLEHALGQRYPQLLIHGAGVERLPNTSYCAIPGVDANGLLAALDGVAAAAGSACDTGSVKPSQVLSEMGVAPEIARCTLRLCVGRTTTAAEVDEAVQRIVAVAGG